MSGYGTEVHKWGSLPGFTLAADHREARVSFSAVATEPSCASCHITIEADAAGNALIAAVRSAAGRPSRIVWCHPSDAEMEGLLASKYDDAECFMKAYGIAFGSAPNAPARAAPRASEESTLLLLRREERSRR
jgi:hypothetical protein